VHIRIFLLSALLLIVGIGTQPDGVTLFKGNLTHVVAIGITVAGSILFAVRLILWSREKRS